MVKNTENQKNNKIKGTADNWENELLGSEEEFAKVSTDVLSEEFDDLMSLQMISIRLPKGLIQDLKFISNHYKFGGYQPFIRRRLELMVIAELKHIARMTMSKESDKDLTIDFEYDTEIAVKEKKAAC